MVYRELLMKNCECTEEGTRNVVAECLGKLALIDPVVLLPKLKSHLARPSALIRSTVITAVKFTISDQVRGIEIHIMLSVVQKYVLGCHLSVNRISYSSNQGGS